MSCYKTGRKIMITIVDIIELFNNEISRRYQLRIIQQLVLLLINY